MATRSDQLHSHQFALQRVIAAVALRDPDAPTASLRRAGGAVLAGTMVGALGLAAFGIYGLLRPGGGDGWRDGGSVIVESVLGREGLGTLMVAAVRGRDLPLVMGIVLVTSTVVWLGNTIAEMLQAVNDKRMRA